MRDSSADSVNVPRIRRACWIAVALLAQFLVGVAAAISAYPGRYSLTTQYLSELGCRQGDERLHALIFNGSLILAGIGLCYLFGTLIRETMRGPIELLVLSGSGMGAGVAVVFIGLLPFNAFPRSHNLAMLAWLTLMLPMLAAWMEWMEWTGRRAPSTGAAMALGRSMRILIFLFPIAACLSLGPGLQKVIVLACIIWLLVFCFQIQRAATAGRIRPGFPGDRKRVVFDEITPGTYDGFH
ncbi:MAG: DUF998 domain-containing protein [Planctomycetaceae bacterium]|nr:DUF998 domain-containing protein [Planctomycetaceae bacterium]